MQYRTKTLVKQEKHVVNTLMTFHDKKKTNKTWQKCRDVLNDLGNKNFIFVLLNNVKTVDTFCETQFLNSFYPQKARNLEFNIADCPLNPLSLPKMFRSHKKFPNI